ncbi:2-hydroxy-3-keto-5-methylthiopentenyl-1-phosphate phosphatase [subsurface metagenome]
MIIQCDFDGTIIRNNLSVLLREKYACGDWQKIDSDYLHGHLTVEQSNKLQFALIKEPKERLQAFVRQHIELRPGFVEFVRYCQESTIPFVIVSSGLDFYIEPVLAEIGMPDLELHCGQTSFSCDGIDVSYYDPEGNIIDQGFKKKYLTWLKKRGKNIIYLGDGLSDLEAACQADHVFATGHLLDLLSSKPVAHSGFSDFHDLLRQVRLL